MRLLTAVLAAIWAANHFGEEDPVATGACAAIAFSLVSVFWALTTK